MRKRIITYTLIMTLVLSFGALGLSYGNEQNELSSINKEISDTKQQLNEGKKKEQELNAEITDLENKIKTMESEIAQLQNDIGKTQETIDTVKANLEEIERQLNQQNDDLSARLRAMYKNGDVGLLDVLLGSTSITDFMSNMDMVQKVHDNDVEILERIETQHQLVEEQKKMLEDLQAQLVAQQTEKATKQNELESDKVIVAQARDEVSEENKKLEQDLDKMNAEASRLNSIIRSLQGTSAYQGDGRLGWPVPGYTTVSSPFGNRIHPVLKYKKMHTGIDIPAPAGTPIAAAESGTVIKAGWNNSYGYMVMIDHGVMSDSGKNLVTLYAHNSRLAVSTGDPVSKGQTIAYCGSTGMSTGNHSHFEVRLDGSYQDPMGWVNR